MPKTCNRGIWDKAAHAAYDAGLLKCQIIVCVVLRMIYRIQTMAALGNNEKKVTGIPKSV